MFTQFFGSYLLNQKLVTPQILGEALEAQKTVRLKLGVLAINAGYMTAEQVEKVHTMQGQVDKRMGDIAVEMGYITSEQVEELLRSQKVGYLLLGQVLVDKGYMSNGEFEKALNDYKKATEMKDIMKNFYDFKSDEYSVVYSEYMALFFRNIIRFIGDDFTPMQPSIIENYRGQWLAMQQIVGEEQFSVAIDTDQETFIQFASRFAGEVCMENDEFVKASVGEFLNVQDGLFCVNASNERETELDLMPQCIKENVQLNIEGKSYMVPVYFPFGTVHILIGKFQLE